MAAYRLAELREQGKLTSKDQTPVEIHLLERRASLGRKLLIAGSSGLNITHEHPTLEEFAAQYSQPKKILPLLQAFTPKDWCEWIEKNLEINTFLGTSRRYFIEEKKAARFLKNWEERLRSMGVEIKLQTEWRYDSTLSSNGNSNDTELTLLTMGGGSWEDRSLSVYTELRDRMGISIADFESSNCGYQVKWKDAFLAEAEGKPLKSIAFTTSRGTLKGELLITKYGLEGTPVYSLGTTGKAVLDLKPAWTEAQIVERLSNVKENLNLMRRVQKKLGLCDAALALWFHHAPAGIKTPEEAAQYLKNFEIKLEGPQPLQEAISSRGGVKWSELTHAWALKKFPGIFCAGEMVDWDAPTGGYLLQACVSSSRFVADQIAVKLACDPSK